jgi:hypothetical protein
VLARKKKVDPVLNWHPNFRVVETLPDIKQVRTGFLVNFAAIFLVLVALGWTVVTEVDIYNVNRDIDRINGQIADGSRVNAKNLASSKQFVAKSKPLQFAARFYTEKVPVLDLLTSLLDARSENIHFDSIDISPFVIDLGDKKKANTQRITISGVLLSENSKPLEEFKNKILASPVLKNRIIDPEKNLSTSTSYDTAAGVFKFTITLVLKPAV